MEEDIKITDEIKKIVEEIENNIGIQDMLNTDNLDNLVSEGEIENVIYS